MRCDEAEPILMEWLDGGLPVGQAAEVEAHLADCARCAALRAELRAALALVHADLVPDLPAAAWERFGADVRARIRLAEEADERARQAAAAPRPPRPRSGLPWAGLRDRMAAWAQSAAFAPVAVATAAAVLLAVGVARYQGGPYPALGGRELTLARDLDVLRAVEQPDDLEIIERLPALLAMGRV
jgi:anti-sigma factor RsiW